MLFWFIYCSCALTDEHFVCFKALVNVTSLIFFLRLTNQSVPCPKFCILFTAKKQNCSDSLKCQFKKWNLWAIITFYLFISTISASMSIEGTHWKWITKNVSFPLQTPDKRLPCNVTGRFLQGVSSPSPFHFHHLALLSPSWRLGEILSSNSILPANSPNSS